MKPVIQPVNMKMEDIAAHILKLNLTAALTTALIKGGIYLVTNAPNLMVLKYTGMATAQIVIAKVGKGTLMDLKHVDPDTMQWEP